MTDEIPPEDLVWEQAEVREAATPRQVVRVDRALYDKIIADYDRRMSTRWGRFLLWLLRKTT